MISVSLSPNPVALSENTSLRVEVEVEVKVKPQSIPFKYRQIDCGPNQVSEWFNAKNWSSLSTTIICFIDFSPSNLVRVEGWLNRFNNTSCSKLFLSPKIFVYYATLTVPHLILLSESGRLFYFLSGQPPNIGLACLSHENLANLTRSSWNNGIQVSDWFKIQQNWVIAQSEHSLADFICLSIVGKNGRRRNSLPLSHPGLATALGQLLITTSCTVFLSIYLYI